MKKNKIKLLLGDCIGLILAFVFFIVPFLFVVVTALKDRREANKLQMTLPSTFHFENFVTVLTENHYQLLTAFKNSIIITMGTVIMLIIFGSMAGYVLQRRKDYRSKILNKIIMLGLMVPTAIIPTIWVLKGLHIYKSLPSIILLEVALNISFTVILYQGFMDTIPVELEEAAFMDGATSIKIYSRIIFPLLKPVTATVIIINAISIFNDFTTPLYFFPGSENVTVQLTLYNYIGKFSNSYNLLFADVLIIIIPMLILFLIFNNRIVDGMTAGSVKG